MIKDGKSAYKYFQVVSFLGASFSTEVAVGPIIDTSEIDSLLFRVQAYQITGEPFIISNIMQSDSADMSNAIPVPVNKFVNSKGEVGAAAKNSLKVESGSPVMGIASVVGAKRYLQIYVASEQGGGTQLSAIIDSLQIMKIKPHQEDYSL